MLLKGEEHHISTSLVNQVCTAKHISLLREEIIPLKKKKKNHGELASDRKIETCYFGRISIVYIQHSESNKNKLRQRLTSIQKTFGTSEPTFFIKESNFTNLCFLRDALFGACICHRKKYHFIGINYNGSPKAKRLFYEKQ